MHAPLERRTARGTGSTVHPDEPPPRRRRPVRIGSPPLTTSTRPSAAKAAYPAFKALTPGERADLLLGLADELEARAEEIAALESAQTGKTIRLATEFDVPGSIDNARFFAGAARRSQDSRQAPTGSSRRR